MKERTIYALGFFDGVHLGHQALLSACRQMAGELGAVPGVVTFHGHPNTLVLGHTPELLNTPQDREKLLRQFGMDTIVSLPFDKNLMEMPWQDFFAMLQRKHTAGLVCGADFRFGHKAEGTAETLRTACAAANIPCAVISQQRLDGIRISSSHIRQLLKTGNMAQVNRFLGHPHLLTGTVISGQQLGRTIGVPTANLLLPQGLAVPKYGVYACKAHIGAETYLAVTNLGTRPTVAGTGITVEAWLLNFDGNLYGKELTLEFHAYLRPEITFPSLEALRQEIQKNKQQTIDFFEKNESFPLLLEKLMI